jgi:Arc/MetJ-type ribon-helix-helix transcriptional regulator
MCYDRDVKVELSEEAREAIEGLVREGGYETAEQAVDAAVALLAAKQKAYWERVNELVEEGRRDIEAGRYTVLTEDNRAAFISEIEARGRARLKARRQD